MSHNNPGASMSVESSTGAGVLLVKLLPAGIGALLIAAVDIPGTKRELFLRVFVAMGSSILLGDVAMDWLHSLQSFAWLDPHKHTHIAAINGIVGGLAWFVLGGATVLLKKFRADPTETLKELKP
jgi:hypothetical protein